jgi:RND family efflux transporter MFP subunit
MLFFVLFLTSCEQKDASKQSLKSAVPVTVMTAKLQIVNVEHRTTGTLLPRKAPVIRSQIAGEIDELLVHEGELIHKGQLLLRMKQKEIHLILQEAQAKLEQAKSLLKQTQRDVVRADKLIGKGYISEEQFDQIHSQYDSAKSNLVVVEADMAHAQFQASQSELTSPVEGHVGRIVVSVGEYVAPNTDLFTIVNDEELLAELPFSEQKASMIKQGQKVVLSSPSAPDQTLTSTITFIAPDISPENRSIKALVVFENHYGWFPGSSVQGIVYLKPITAIMMPEECVVTRDNKQVVYVIKNNKASTRVVETGYRIQGWVALKGVEPGDQVAVTGSYYLFEGAPVHIDQQGTQK